MQRRAAAVYFVLFVLVGAGAYGFIQVGMSEPTVDLAGPTYASGDELTVDGRTYTVSSIDTEEGEVARLAGDAELTWFNESRRATAMLDNGSSVAFEGGQYQVVVPNGTDGTFQLVEQREVSAILANDSAVENATVTRDGVEHVVFRDNQSIRPVSEYLPPADRAEFSTGDQFDYQAENVTATVDSVSGSGVGLSWAAPGEETVTVGAGANATLNGVTHFAHFPSENRVQLLPSDAQYGAYTAELSAIEYWEERRNGVWGVVILSVIAGFVLLSTAYLPGKG
jgi:hypothetical protein